MGEKKTAFEPLVGSQKVMEFLDCTKEALKNYRDSQKLPFYPMSRTEYKYLLSEVEKWRRERRMEK